MAVRTFATAGINNLWSNAANWDTGVPVNNDSAIIPAGQTCEFDANQSAWANGLVGLTLNGELYASLTPGSYYLKLAGSITATVTGGILRAGSSGARYPSNCVFTIYSTGNYQIDNNISSYITDQFWCYAPVVQYAQAISATAKAITSVTVGATTTIGCTGHGYVAGNAIYLANVGGFTDAQLNNRIFEVETVPNVDSFTIRYPDPDTTVVSTGWGPYTGGGLVCPSQAEAAGATVIEIDQDASTDPEWLRAGAMVRIDNINRNVQSEVRIIASVAAGSITITAGLTSAKLSGSKVILVTRNVKLNSSATAISNGMIRYGTGHQLDAEIRPGSTSTSGVQDATNSVFSGGVISGCTYGVNSGSGHTFSGGAISGCTYGVNSGSGHTFSGGAISGCALGVYSGSGHTFSGGVISGCSQGVNSGSGHFQWPGIVMSGNTRDMYGLCVFDGYAASLNSTTQVAAFNNNVEGLNPPNGRAQIVIRDIGGAPGALKAWMYAGRITDRSGIEPNFAIGATRKYIFENNATPVFLDRVIYAEAGKPIWANVSMQKDVNGMTETPRVQIFDEAYDPFDGYAVGAEQVMADDLVQHDYVLTYTALRTGNHVVRIRGKNAAGNLYAGMRILIGSLYPIFGELIVR